MTMGDIVKDLYKRGYYEDSDLPIFVEVGYITADEYKELTNKDYAA